MVMSYFAKKWGGGEEPNPPHPSPLVPTPMKIHVYAFILAAFTHTM